MRHMNFKYILFAFTLFFLCCFFQTDSCYAGAYAYIANGGEDTISVIEIVENSIVGSISVASSPYGVAVDPNGDYVFVSNSSDGTVSVIDPLFYSVIKTFSVGSGPKGIAASPDGTYLYVANNGDNTVSIIDFWNDEIGSVAVGREPLGVVAGPEGKYIYVCNYSDSSISVISGETDTVISTITNDISSDQTAFDGPFGIATSSNGHYIYVVDNTSAKLAIIDAESFYNDDEADAYALYGSVAVGNDPRDVCVVTIDNYDYAYVSNYGDNTVSIVRFSDLSVNEVTVGSGPICISSTPDGDFVYVVNNLDSTVSVIDTADNTVTSSITAGGSPVSFGNFIGGKTPFTPTNLEATLKGDTTDVISLTWEDKSDDEIGFKIVRKKYTTGSYGGIKTLSTDTTSYEDSGLDGNATYYYKVYAYNHMGNSDYSNEADVTTEESDSTSGCFIATAAYGSSFEPKVRLLRKFRDHFLLSNTWGKTFVHLYYEKSPPIAHFISNHGFLRALTRWSLLPLIGSAWLMLAVGPQTALLLLAVFLAAFVPVTAALLKRRKSKRSFQV